MTALIKHNLHWLLQNVTDTTLSFASNVWIQSWIDMVICCWANDQSRINFIISVKIWNIINTEMWIRLINTGSTAGLCQSGSMVERLFIWWKMKSMKSMNSVVPNKASNATGPFGLVCLWYHNYQFEIHIECLSISPRLVDLPNTSLSFCWQRYWVVFLLTHQLSQHWYLWVLVKGCNIM